MVTLGDKHPEHTPRPPGISGCAHTDSPPPHLPHTEPRDSQAERQQHRWARAPRHSPTSSLANLTSRRATYSGSSPPSSMRPSQ